METAALEPKTFPIEDYDALVGAYGDPRPFLKQDGRITDAWSESILGERIYFPSPTPLGWDLKGNKARYFRCHRRLSPFMGRTMAKLEQEGVWKHVTSFGGCFNYRTKRGDSQELSIHSWGAALDLNSHEKDLQLGKVPSSLNPFVIHVVPVLQSCGLVWGGAWHRQDGMHVQATRKG